METTISTLLGQYENGAITRRELIRSLALLAFAGPAAAQSAAAPAAAGPAAAPAPRKNLRRDNKN